MTIFPNLLNHLTQEDAGLEVHQFFPLVRVKCSPDLQFFLCTMYAPICTIMPDPVPPCRHLCQSARTGCENLMNKFGFQWPKNLNCDLFPEEGLCVGENKTKSANDGSQAPGSGPGVVQPKQPQPLPPLKEPTVRPPNATYVCPRRLEVRTEESSQYTLYVGSEKVKHCALPCDHIFFSKKERNFLRWWTVSWAVACAAATLFTVLTFFVDMARFRYPVRPIFFLALCYLCISSVYIAGFAAGDSISCYYQPSHPQEKEDLSGLVKRATEPEHIMLTGDGWKISLATQGTRHSSCTALAMVHYFFSVASSIWWVVLCFTWFLAASLMWGQEAIEAQAPYFHLVAWGVSALLMIAVLVTQNIDGDLYTGVCSVGNWNGLALRHFVILPLCICLGVGLFFLLCGFISMWRIRRFIKHQDGNKLEKIDKLEKLMLRISVFSVMYVVPALATLACLLYQSTMMSSWLQYWFQRLCITAGTKSLYGFHFPCPSKSSKVVKAEHLVFIVKYFVALIVGITCAVWILSGKTLTSWHNFYARVVWRRSRVPTHDPVPVITAS